MLRKRLVGVITVRDGRAVQSFGYRRYLPLGRPECLAENLDRWGADEIIVLCIDRSARQLGPDFELLNRLGALGLSTPLVYGGGIRNAADAGAVIQCGADRLCVDALLRTDRRAVDQIVTLVGSQAVIGVLPLSLIDGAPALRNYLTGKDEPLADTVLEPFATRAISEALIVDWQNEGRPDAFDGRLISSFPASAVPLIAFGGISSPGQAAALLDCAPVVAAAVGNFLAYQEHAIQKFKQRLAAQTVRAPFFLQSP